MKADTTVSRRAHAPNKSTTDARERPEVVEACKRCDEARDALHTTMAKYPDVMAANAAYAEAFRAWWGLLEQSMKGGRS